MTKFDDNWRGFLKLCREFKTEKQLNDLLALFLTHEEKGALAMRYAIVKELIKGRLTQREIAADLNVSIAKITRGSNALKIMSDNVRRALNRKFK